MFRLLSSFLFDATSFSISGAQLKEAGCKKVINFYSVQYLVTRVTFCVFTCNSRMVQRKMAVKTSEIYSNKGDFGKTRALNW